VVKSRSASRYLLGSGGDCGAGVGTVAEPWEMEAER
jgi:hypothetical protein